VVVRDTLRAIARRAGARTESQAQRMMIAIFRANPHAFEGNINVLHLGALLSIPSAQDVAAIDAVDARREVRAQMTAWRLDGRPAAPHRVAAVPAATSAPGAAPAAAASEPVQPHAADAAATAALKDRVQSLEKALDEVHQQLATENAKIQDLKQMTAPAAALAAEPQPAESAAAPDAPTSATVGSPVQVERMRSQEHPAPVLAALAPSPAQPTACWNACSAPAMTGSASISAAAAAPTSPPWPAWAGA